MRSRRLGNDNCACDDQDGSVDTEVDDEGGGTNGSNDDDDRKDDDENSTTFIFMLTVAGVSHDRGISDWM